MTDARFPDRWLNDARLQRVSPEAYRAFGNAMMWAVSNKTDGHIPAWAIGLIPHMDETLAGELDGADLWAKHERGGWVILDYGDTQTSRDELDALAARRRSDRNRKAEERLRKAQAAALSRDVSQDGSRDSPVESVRLGQARTGQDVHGRRVTDPWANAPQPEGRPA